ncbi:MAG TPA: hypothetical protein PL059_06840 [Spirochaetota bacterium]|nr:hypothetical protein [Spirochaetota bacterium]HOM08822.1 hypothetical protein [Spirochaetota bacterium]HPP49380.1 hypothetical protein [Spirochaetota bacterium]
MTLDIQLVENSKSTMFPHFINIPHMIYKNNDQWVPWFHNEMKLFIDKKHPLFLHSDGDFFVAMRNNSPAGRIFVFENTMYNKTHNMKSAHFYFIDFYDDREVADCLFSAAIDWAKKRHCNSLLGPMGFGGVTGGGLLIDGFEHRASMTMMMYNHPYYRVHIEAFGFTKYLDNFSFYLPSTAQLPDGLKQTADALLAKGEFKVLKFKSKKELQKVADDVIHVFMKTLSDHAGNYELTKPECDYIVKSLLQVANPELIKIITYKGTIIGFLFGFHDLSAALQKADGKLTPLSIYRIIREYKKTNWILVNGMGILPEFQGLGANAVLYAELEKTIRQYPQFKHLEMVQIQETTSKMLSNVKTLNGRTFKTHRMYQLPI